MGIGGQGARLMPRQKSSFTDCAATSGVMRDRAPLRVSAALGIASPGVEGPHSAVSHYGEWRSIVRRRSLSVTSREIQECPCVVVDRVLTDAVLYPLFKLSARGVKTTGGFFCSPGPGKGDGENVSDVFQTVLHDEQTLAHGDSYGLSFNT